MVIRDLYKSCPNVTGIISINVTNGYNQSSAVATIVCESTTLNLNDILTVDMGYSDEHEQVFYGRVKNITRNRDDGSVTIVAKDILVDATDFFIVADNPEEPFKRQNIKAENLIRDLLALANLTNYAANVPLEFRYGVSVPAEFNLLSVMDACNQVANILAWHVYADVTTVRFEDVRPYYRTAAQKNLDYGLSNQVSDTVSHQFCIDGSISGPAVKATIKAINRTYSDEGLRNKVVVYGRGDLVVSASDSSPYLPDGFYKTAVIASPLIDSNSMASAAAEYNLKLYNRLTETCSLDVLGDPSIKPRQFCEISDTFTQASGYWFISQVNHIMGADGYTTKLVCTK